MRAAHTRAGVVLMPQEKREKRLMRPPLKIQLETLAATYGLDDLGMAWIQTEADGRRSLVLCEVPPAGLASFTLGEGAEIYDVWLPADVTGPQV